MLMLMGRTCDWAPKAPLDRRPVASAYVLLAVPDCLITLGLPLLSGLPEPVQRNCAALVFSPLFYFRLAVNLNLGLSASPCNRLCNPKTYSGWWCCTNGHVVSELLLSFNPDVN
jgi:hypothetical protein